MTNWQVFPTYHGSFDLCRRIEIPSIDVVASFTGRSNANRHTDRIQHVESYFFYRYSLKARSQVPHQKLTKKMASGLRPSHRSAALNSTSVTKRRNLRRLNSDLYRLSTFRLWRTNTQSHVSSVVLSKSGFSYTDERDKVRCDTCGLEIDSWQPGMNPRQVHMERSPQCPFVVARAELFTINGTYRFLCISALSRYVPKSTNFGSSVET